MVSARNWVAKRLTWSQIRYPIKNSTRCPENKSNVFPNYDTQGYSKIYNFRNFMISFVFFG